MGDVESEVGRTGRGGGETRFPEDHDGDRPTDDRVRRARIRVTGVVQGVGFRPFVYRLATDHDLTGFVLNDSEGVLVEVEGESVRIQRFLRRLSSEAPPLSHIEGLRVTDVAVQGEPGFEIVDSEVTGPPSALVSPDTATCSDCLKELFDPRDRRYRYPFINCTNCGPRFTIIQGVPYDRSRTTMSGFRMCASCRAEYEDPTDRRFHAQPNACPECGPAVRLLDAEGRPRAEPSSAPDAPIRTAARALNEGAVLAVKGLGGYHLACVADDQEAVARLRERKHREDKPFALMVADLDTARAVVHTGPEEEGLLRSRARPIVLARRRSKAAVAVSVAPGHRDLGVMLPYSPLHHLLLDDAGSSLVMTSGNRSDEPIAFRDEEALDRLGDIADLFLVHDRPIHVRSDDSVMRVVSLPRETGRSSGPGEDYEPGGGVERRPLMLRRSRGFVPVPVSLPVSAPPLLACGGHLKNTFTVARGGWSWTSTHIGDLEHYETLRSFREGIDHFEDLFSVRPRSVAHDHHPEYLSTKYAKERGVPTVSVQHHHAHLAACLAEHARTDPALGVIFDGTGHGEDEAVWGGELLLGDASSYRRLGHLWPVRMPGGEAAIRQPWRMACAWLTEVRGAVPSIPPTLEGRIDGSDWRNVARMALTGLASPQTTSMGRLFDAVSALCGLRTETTYEGQAAIDLEMIVEPTEEGHHPMPLIRSDEGVFLLDGRATVRTVVGELQAGVEPGVVSARFHAGVARGTAEACRVLARTHDLSSVVLSGGVFQNVVLLEETARRLADDGLRALIPERLPPNDGGLSYGQSAVAATRIDSAAPA